MFTSTGILEYHTRWLVLNCCHDLAKYYRRSLKRKALSAPPYGAHVTVVAGNYEEPAHKHLWRKYEGETIEFAYGHEVHSHDSWYWLNVHCERLLDIREELGLRRELRWPLHLTVARDRDV